MTDPATQKASNDLMSWLGQQVHVDRNTAVDALRDWIDGPDGDEMAAQPDSILVGAHLVRWNPRRVLTECEVKSWLLNLHAQRGDGRGCIDCDTLDEPCHIHLIMAIAYRDRDGYRDSWAPDGRV